jgi:hypothetical protein
MSWLVAVQEASEKMSDAQMWAIALVVIIVTAAIVLMYLAGRADGRFVEREDDRLFGRARSSIDGLIDDAEHQIRRNLWRKP